MPAAFQLKITLATIQPRIWRRVVVPDCTLDELHKVIQVVMGWESSHLYSFDVAGRKFTHPEMDEGELNMEDATKTKLSEVVREAGKKFGYRYDFGDDWRHEVLVEKVVPMEAGMRLIMCLAGGRACPPEDVGGVEGYAEYLQALADPKHEEHDQWLEWRGEFDPESFNLKVVNRKLRIKFR
jgi:hypothetical protein